MEQNLDFGNVINFLKRGLWKKIARRGWNGKGQFVSIRHPDSTTKELAYLQISTIEKFLVPWVASHTDLLSEDWYEVK